MCVPACKTAASVLRAALASAVPWLSSPASAPTQVADLRTGELPHCAVSSWLLMGCVGATWCSVLMSLVGAVSVPSTQTLYVPVALVLC